MSTGSTGGYAWIAPLQTDGFPISDGYIFWKALPSINVPEAGPVPPTPQFTVFKIGGVPGRFQVWKKFKSKSEK